MRFSQTSPLRARRRFRRRPRPRRFACRMEELAIPQCASLCGGAKNAGRTLSASDGCILQEPPWNAEPRARRPGSFALPLRCWHEDAGAKFHHQFWAAASGCARSVLRLVLELDGQVVERADPPYRPSSVRRRFSLPAIRRLRPEASQDTTERNPPSGSNLRLDRF